MRVSVVASALSAGPRLPGIRVQGLGHFPKNTAWSMGFWIWNYFIDLVPLISLSTLRTRFVEKNGLRYGILDSSWTLLSPVSFFLSFSPFFSRGKKSQTESVMQALYWFCLAGVRVLSSSIFFRKKDFALWDSGFILDVSVSKLFFSWSVSLLLLFYTVPDRISNAIILLILFAGYPRPLSGQFFPE